MDSRTHVELANKLLALCKADSTLSVVSLFPQIDRWPHTLHRMYAHTVFKAQSISATGLQVLADDGWEDEVNAYEVSRFKEEKQRLLSYLPTPSWSRTLGADEREAALMSYISHVYLDTYNQPAQPFAPLSVYCSGQWALWEKLGDFRRTLYTTHVINDLRGELFTDRFWNGLPSMSATALTQAMMQRMCQHSLGKIGEDVIPVALGSQALAPCPSGEVGIANEFLREFEAILNKLHIQHLTRKPTSSGTQSPARASALA